MKLLLLLAGFAALAKCSLAAPAGAQKDIPMETSAPEKPSEATTPGLLKTLKPEPKDEEPTPGAFQGDMMLTDDQLRKVEEAIDDQKAGRKKRKATIYESQRWSYKIIPYVIEPSSSGQSSLIRSAMDHWEQNTCLRFEPLTSSHSSRLEHTSYISFFRGNGCWSHVGRSFTNRQQISIGSQCGYFGTIVHEIGHAIGFHHEQSRPDRDEYITVNYENVQQGREHNFAKYTWGSVTDSNVEYDVGSIMHYGGYGFSSNGRPTITTLDPRLNSRLGQRTALSAADIELANRIYECDDVEDCSNADECLNGGYHDADCDCVCPSSYSGDLCQDGGPTVRPPADCSDRFTEMTGEITSPNYPNNYDDNTACVYEIEGPYGSTIELTFLDIKIETETLCRYDAVEVRKDDINSIGEKFCGNILPPVQISSSNQMMVSFTSDPSITRRGFKATYVIIIQTTTVFSTTTLQTTPLSTTTLQTTTPSTTTLQTTNPSTTTLQTTTPSTTTLQTTNPSTTTLQTTTPSTTTLQTTNPSTTTLQTTPPTATTLQTTDTPVIGSCGGTFIGAEGRLASPNYPNNYDNNLQCDYVIEVDDGRRVELNFENFGLENESTCRWDSLTINLGDGIKVGMKMCGREYPAASLVSIGNRMELKLKTDGSVNDRGFVANYRAIDL